MTTFSDKYRPEKPNLKVVSDHREGGTIAERLAELQATAGVLVKVHVEQLLAALEEAGAVATAIADGGAIYPAGVRDASRRLVEEMRARAETIEAIISRSR